MANHFSGETGAERRRFPRKPMKLRVAYQCLAKDRISPKEAHVALDVGSGGLAMRSHEPLAKGQIVMLTLFIPLEERLAAAGGEVPDYSESDCVGANILARVARCTSLGLGDYQLGIQFLDADGQSRERLKKFLMNYRLYQADSPVNY
ncbi:MAG: PilZ domain-containing protein [Candidatus Firestonebacteria bacterium]|nr:PilZ domain-containing protein [Candidatus Firestonebacteria bacterium]